MGYLMQFFRAKLLECTNPGLGLQRHLAAYDRGRIRRSYASSCSVRPHHRGQLAPAGLAYRRAASCNPAAHQLRGRVRAYIVWVIGMRGLLTILNVVQRVAARLFCLFVFIPWSNWHYAVCEKFATQKWTQKWRILWQIFLCCTTRFVATFLFVCVHFSVKLASACLKILRMTKNGGSYAKFFYKTSRMF